MERGFTRARAVRHASRVVQIEKHRRTFCDCLQQVTEFSERAGANHVAIVLSEIIRLWWTLLRVDVEVIEPEVSHHLFELPVARNCTRNAR